MGDRYLADLADVCRWAGLDVIEVDGWHHRARGSGGYDSGRPNHVMVHHTASGAGSDGWPDVNYCTFSDEDAPLCNLYLNRGGSVWVCAGGATNTNGSGQDPCNTTADDSMNSSAIGIEAGNNGSGELWPRAQLDALLTLTRALCDHYGIPTSRVHSHQEWAPGRKVDPAGPDRYASGGGTWNMDAFRSDLEDDMPSANEVATAVWAEPCVSEVDGQTYQVGVFIHSTHKLAHDAAVGVTELEARVAALEAKL